MTVETATAADGPAVIALWRACGLTRPWNDPQADFARAIGTPASAVLLIRNDGDGDGDGHVGTAVAASVMIGFDGHRGWVYYLGVSPAARRGGFGRTLMTAAEQWLRAAGAPKIQLMVRNDNDAALAFYAALGLEAQPVVTLGRFLKDDI